MHLLLCRSSTLIDLREQDKVQGKAQGGLGTRRSQDPSRRVRMVAEGEATLGGVLFEHMLCKQRGPLTMGGRD